MKKRDPSPGRLLACLVGLVIVVAWAVADRALFSQLVHVAEPLPVDPVGIFDVRLAPVARELPASGIYGFVCDGAQMPRLRLAQYALLPRLIEPGTGRERIVGVFDRPWEAYVAQHGLKVVKAFGPGVLLLEKSR